MKIHQPLGSPNPHLPSPHGSPVVSEGRLEEEVTMVTMTMTRREKTNSN